MSKYVDVAGSQGSHCRTRDIQTWNGSARKEPSRDKLELEVIV